MSDRLRWKLWTLAARLPGVCPSNAHTVIVCAHPDRRRNPFIDGVCRRDCAATGSCWCGKLRQDRAFPAEPVPPHPEEETGR